jgi:hypothetical protein
VGIFFCKCCDDTPAGEPGGGLPDGFTAGDIIQFNGTDWEANNEGAPAIGDMLIWDGSSWVPGIEPHEVIYYPAIGGGADDSAALQAFLTTWAGIRQVSLIKGNIYQIDAPVTVPSGTYLKLNGATINTNMGLTGSPLHAVFVANIVIAANTTVAASNTIGARTFSATALAGLVAGSLVRIAKSGLRAMTYTVISTAGVGPFTITVDRPILYQFDAADVVSRLTSMPQDITIDGEGASIVGVADRFLEFAGSRRCNVRNIHANYTGGANANIGFSYDVGGYENEFHNILLDGGNQLQLGISLESQESSHVIRSTATRVTNWAIPIYDSVECTVLGCRANVSGNGIGFLSDGVGIGCLDCKAIDCFSDGHTTDGFATGPGPSHRCSFIGCSAKWNAGHGINVVANSLDTLIDSCLFEGNATRQAITFGGADRTTFTDCHFVGAAGAPNIYVLGLTYVTGCVMTAGNYGIYGDGEVHLDNCRIDAFTLAAVEVRPNRFCTIHNCDFNAATVALTAVTVVAVSKCYIDGLTLSGLGAGGTGITVQAGSTLRFRDYDPGAAAAPLNVVAGGFASIGALVSGGAGAAQAVAWPDIKATDQVTFMRTLNGGAPGLEPTVVVTAGVGFTAAFAVGDTSTNQWRVD